MILIRLWNWMLQKMLEHRKGPSGMADIIYKSKEIMKVKSVYCAQNTDNNKSPGKYLLTDSLIGKWLMASENSQEQWFRKGGIFLWTFK